MVRAFHFAPYFAHGRQVWYFNSPGWGINRFTNVVASITELGGPPGGPLDYPLIGSVVMVVENVAPNDNGNVYVRYFIDYSRDLPFRITLFVDP
jgi:hypothetical protein